MKLAGADGFPFRSTSRNDEALIGNTLLGTRLISFFKIIASFYLLGNLNFLLFLIFQENATQSKVDFSRFKKTS
ncbi:hypothetical protein HanXRQr2_Chr04g0182111 [Helianthus annuus]|uniref:Uncharacterized protein n=1 Tax=Helianthus annuus TaxID=4232 RepID=A0A251V0W3_HELAN|nr:hypothetical protein HanXRQr2_Chr04g0182111 [Helianthus annuus]